jgi:oligosaccharide repeat unit polymerase
MRFRSPAIVYFSVWLLVLALYSLKWSLLLTPLSAKTLFFLVASVLIISLPTVVYKIAALVIRKRRSVVKGLKDYIVTFSQLKKLRVLFYVWFFFSLLEITVFQSIPLLSFFGIGRNYTYHEWGIPTLHGLLNAIFSVISNYIFYFYLRTRNKKYLFYFFLCLIWPLLLVSRILFLSIFVEALFIFLYFNKIRISTLIRSVFVFVAIILVFGVVGDIRSGGGDGLSQLVRPSESYPDFLPSGFLWVYIYITSPINNINYNIDAFPQFSYHPDIAFSNILPSIIKSKITISGSDTDFELVDANLNVSTFHMNYLMSFGYVGALLFYVLFGLLFLICQRNALKGHNIRSVFILVLILHNVVFTTFSDLFLLLPFAFQLLIHIYVGYRFKFK